MPLPNDFAKGRGVICAPDPSTINYVKQTRLGWLKKKKNWDNLLASFWFNTETVRRRRQDERDGRGHVDLHHDWEERPSLAKRFSTRHCCVYNDIFFKWEHKAAHDAFVSAVVFQRYKSYSPYDMQESIMKEVKGDLQRSFLVLGTWDWHWMHDSHCYLHTHFFLSFLCFLSAKLWEQTAVLCQQTLWRYEGKWIGNDNSRHVLRKWH